MKFIKYLVAGALALCASASICNAQNVRFLGGGSSALFQELGSASQSIPGISCIWTHSGGATVAANDARPGAGLENGMEFVAWGTNGGANCQSPAPGFDIYAYMQLDSVIGDRCYFENDGTGSGCIQVLTVSALDPGSSPSKVVGQTDTPIPAAVINALNGQHFFVAGTDVRPEDAKFATMRILTPCNQLIPRQPFNQDSYYTFGLGYQTGNPNVGTPVQGVAALGGGSFNVVNFNIVGNDPITGSPVRAYATNTVGAQPIVISVSPITDAAGVGAASDVNGFTLTLFYQGVLGRSTDLIGPPSPAKAVTVLVREPLSGTYNTFEYSVPNGTQFHASQDYGNCLGSGAVWTNPFNLANANGIVGSRQRVIGTGKMVAALQAGAVSDNRMGYFFWSAGNGSGLTNVKYLKVNGIDPFYDAGAAYDGVIPGNDIGHPLTSITFGQINAGNYPIWSALRLVGPPGNAGVATMLTALNTINPTQHDYIAPANLKVWHSHFYINGIGLGTQEGNGNTIASPNDLCSTVAPPVAEVGGDAGGANLLVKNNLQFCMDYNAPIGLVNKTQ